MCSLLVLYKSYINNFEGGEFKKNIFVIEVKEKIVCVIFKR